MTNKNMPTKFSLERQIVEAELLNEKYEEYIAKYQEIRYIKIKKIMLNVMTTFVTLVANNIERTVKS